MRITLSNKGELRINEDTLELTLHPGKLRCEADKTCEDKAFSVLFCDAENIELMTLCRPELRQWKTKENVILVLEGKTWRRFK